MATMNISLPDSLKSWVEEQRQTGHFSNTSDYMRDLLRREQERLNKIQRMQTLIDEGRASGVSELSMDDIKAQALAATRKDA